MKGYFGYIRVVDRKMPPRPVLEEDFNPKPPTLALHAPPPTPPTMPQVQDDFYAMNMNSRGFSMDQPFGSGELNWAFNFALDPNKTPDGNLGSIPMDIEAWSSVCHL